jgi:hypothetical protein
MDQQHQGVGSTQPTPRTRPLWVFDIFNDPMEDVPQEPNNNCTHFVFVAIYKINGNLFTNQTGRFPITSNRSHAYVVVLYIFDANMIRSISIKNHSKEDLLRAYCKIYNWLILHGFKPFQPKLGSRTSKGIKTFVTMEQTCIQNILAYHQDYLI